MRKDQRPSLTSLFEKWLDEQNDFVTLAQAIKGTGMTNNQVTACLAHFKKHKAADFIVQDGVTFWYSTPDTDDRLFKVEERIVEEPGSRKRGSRVKDTSSGSGVRNRTGGTGA